MQLGLHVRERDGVPILIFCGALDECTCPLAGEAVAALLDRGHRRLVFDLAAVTQLEEDGARLLLSAHQCLRERGGSLHLCRCPPPVMRELEVVGLSPDLPLHATEEEAVAAALKASSGAGSRSPDGTPPSDPA